MINIRPAENDDIKKIIAFDTIIKNDPMKKLIIKFGFIDSGTIYNLDDNNPEKVYYLNISRTNY
jgi:hypothetical protein